MLREGFVNVWMWNSNFGFLLEVQNMKLMERCGYEVVAYGSMPPVREEKPMVECGTDTTRKLEGEPIVFQTYHNIESARVGD